MTLRLEKTDGIARLIIDRPDRRGAFSQAMWEKFPDLLSEAMDDPAIRALSLEAGTPGAAFCAGADIEEFSRKAGDADWRKANQAAIGKVQYQLARAPKPTIATIEGDCIGGGCGLAIACDMRIAGPGARFGITPARLGLVYPLHDTKLLVDLVGPSQASRILFTGTLIDAAEAARIGLVTAMEDDPRTASETLLQQLLAASPHSQKMGKHVIRRVRDGQTEDDSATGAIFDEAFVGADFQEGVDAFLNKRQPKF